MADQRITQLTRLSKEGASATDVLPIADVSASQTKKITVQDLVAAGIDLVNAGEIDLEKLDQTSTTKLGTVAFADDAITAAKLGHDSSIAVQTIAPSGDNFEGRGYFNSSTGNLQIFNGSDYQQVVMPTGGIGDLQIVTSKLADAAVTTDKVSPLGTVAYADGSITGVKIASGTITANNIANDTITAAQLAPASVANSELAGAAVTYDKIQNVTADRLIGRTTGVGSAEEIPLTAAGRALLDDADAAAQRSTLGLGTLATQNGIWTNGSSFAGTSTGTNTGDQTITLTGDVTGTGTGTFTATIATNAITESKVAGSAITATKIASDAVTADKLADSSSVIVAAATPTGNGAFVGQQWVNTNTGLEYTWTGSVWQRLSGISTLSFAEAGPLALSASYPDNFSAEIAVDYDAQAANTVWAGPASGSDLAPTFRTIVPEDLPDATASTKGVIHPGTGLAVSSGILNHSNVISGATFNGITFDDEGHVSAATALVATDIPDLDASKITTGTFGATFITDGAIDSSKLANYSTAQIGETLPVAGYAGQIFFNPLEKTFFLWDGNVWQPIGVSTGAIIFAGTYDASNNLINSTTTAGAALGLTISGVLPAASADNSNYYLVVSTAGSGTTPAPVAALAPPDLLLSDGTAWREVDTSSAYQSQSANNIAFTPAGDIGSSTVQLAIEEVSIECRNVDNVASGTLAVARGGTSFSSYTKGDLIVASGTTGLAKLAAGTNAYVLRANSSTTTGLEWGADFVGTVTNVTSTTAALTVSGGTTTPALTLRSATTSVNGIVQLSDSTSTTSSTLAATPTAVKAAYDLANAALPKAGGTVTGAVVIGTAGSFAFEGTTDDAFETFLVAADPTDSDKTITFPNVSGTVALTSQLDDGTF